MDRSHKYKPNIIKRELITNLPPIKQWIFFNFIKKNLIFLYFIRIIWFESTANENFDIRENAK